MPLIVGIEFTVNVAEAEHPELFTYVIVVVPALTPVTKPVDETLAIFCEALDQALDVAAVPLPVN